MLEAIKTYFETIPSLHRALILAGGITFFWIIEFAIPLFQFKYNKTKHAALNIFFTLTTIVINFAFALIMVKASDYVVANGWGLLQIVKMSILLELIVGLLLLDLIGAYLVHLIEHKVKFLWKFHMVHHADVYVIGVVVLGAPMWLVLLYQSVSVVLTQFNHANVRIPKWFDQTIGLILVSPNMHRVHHHVTRPQTDSNYGNIFSFWDRLFGTYDSTNINEIVFGLDVVDNSEHADISYQLKMPFDKSIKSDY
jgi:sterol desaturase/sphingolipid hydroxylase (fatty acid hydroxylase superfamily)